MYLRVKSVLVYNIYNILSMREIQEKSRCQNAQLHYINEGKVYNYPFSQY